eukprot:22925-Eustigmatos_ZCMA.PRE.1
MELRLMAGLRESRCVKEVLSADVDRLLQFCVARFYTTEAPSKVADIMVNAKREFENTSIAAQ